MERFNRTYRADILDHHSFGTIGQVREITREWIHTYNQLRPHDSIGRQTPVGFLRKRMGNDHFPTLMTDQPKPLHSPFNRVAV